MEVTKVERVERPMYRILDVAGFFGPDDTLWAENSEIYYDGEPALEMEPLNEAARTRYVALLERLDAEGRKVAEKLGRPYTGLNRTLEGGLQIATAIQRQDMSVMGNKDKEVHSIEAVDKPEAELLGSTRRKPGRPRKIA